jgi:hypothetical protein
MIRTVDMQSVLTQSVNTGKVNQTEQQNQDMLFRHMALAAEEEKVQQRSSVADSGQAEHAKLELKRDKDRRHGKRRSKRETPDESSTDEQEQSTGTFIDITI